MLDRLNFRLGEIIGLMHALEKRYYQNKTQLRYNFGSVYLHIEIYNMHIEICNMHIEICMRLIVLSIPKGVA